MTTLTRDARDWIQGLCRRFSDATGWPLTFVPADSDDGEVLEVSSDSDSACWSTPIDDGEERTGYLRIDLPEDTRHDRAFLSVCELAEIFGQLLSRVTAANRSLASHSEEVSALADMGASFPQADDLPTALHQLLRTGVQLTGFRGAAFFLLDPSTSRLNLRVVYQLESKAVPGDIRDLTHDPPDLEALARGRTVLRRRPRDDAGEWLPQGCATGLCLPVQSESGPIGTLWLFDRRSRTPEDREIHVLQGVATQTAALLERAVLLKESETQHRIKSELRAAAGNQTDDIFRELPDDAPFEAAGLCTSHHEVGGDLCELIPLDEHRTAVAVGDASGDSIPAALVMASVRGAVRSLCQGAAADLLQTDRVMQRLNRALLPVCAHHQFMSLLFGVLDSRTSRFTYTNAGHPKPILVRGGEPASLESHGVLLGVLDEAEYKQSSVKLGAGDLLVFFSDGISEAMSGRRQMFRSDGIIEAVRGAPHGSAEEVFETVLNKLEVHTGGKAVCDDRTLLVLRMGESFGRNARR